MNLDRELILTVFVFVMVFDADSPLILYNKAMNVNRHIAT